MKYTLALQDILCTKPLLAHTLCQRFGVPAAILEAPREALAATDAEWRTLRKLRDAVEWKSVEAMRAYCTANGIHILDRRQATYPLLLAECADPPQVLFVEGNISALSERPAVAVVGSRKATPYGRAMAESIAGGLAVRGITIVSGLAVGIDGVAHRTALAAGGQTVGVLGGGHARFYPREHRTLAAQMRAQGAVVSEFPPFVTARPAYFPQRNRIISGLSLAVVVIEAAERSGTLTTARHALEQGRAVFAVPGAVGQLNTRGTHHLLKQGAQIAETAEDILEVIRPMWERRSRMAWAVPPAAPAVKPGGPDDPIGACVWPLLREACVLDILVAKANRSVGEVAAWLMAQQVAGALRALPGNRYVQI